MISSHRKTIYQTIGREPVHPFPARMAPGIALEIVAKATRPLRVLDPMMGSGTVLAVARSKGHRAFGIDIDPLAVLISSVWTTAIDPQEVRNRALDVLAHARAEFAVLRTRDAYPEGADMETKRFVAYWFDAYVRRQLASLANAIGHVHSASVRNTLWCAFSRLIITKQSGASRAMDLSHSRPHRAFDRAPTKPFHAFLSAVDRVVRNCIDQGKDRRGPAARSRQGDARALPLEDGSIDLVLTSPPYLNAIDYMRCSKFSLVWMGYGVAGLRELRARSIGTEVGQRDARNNKDTSEILAKLRLRPALEPKHEARLARFIDDMGRALAEVARVLAPRGRAVYVVGENTVGGTYVRNAAVVTAVAERVGLRLVDRRTRALPPNRRYLPPPSGRPGIAALDGRMRREVVLSFFRGAGSRALAQTDVEPIRVLP